MSHLPCPAPPGALLRGLLAPEDGGDPWLWAVTVLGGKGVWGSSWNVLGCMEPIQGRLGCCMGLILKHLQGVCLILGYLGEYRVYPGMSWGCAQCLSQDVLWEYGVNPGMSWRLYGTQPGRFW